ncbi:MAG: YibE/F family protein [Clostridia bacterium]|nr:YibE/F family protein [Clostridia bacterium]
MKKHLLMLLTLVTLLSTLSFGETVSDTDISEYNTDMTSSEYSTSEDTMYSSQGDLVDQEFVTTYEHGEIIQVEDRVSEGDYSYEYQQCVVQIVSGTYAGDIVEIENAFSENEFYNIRVKAGDPVILCIDDYGTTKEVNIADHSRQHLLLGLIIIFLLTLVIVGRLKGFKSVITISLTIWLIYKVLLPGMLAGKNPLFLTIIIATVITFATILIVSGFHTKSFSAIIGTLFGVVMAGAISIIAGNMVKLTGLSSHEAAMLLYLPQNITFNYKDLLFSGILLGALGAVMDVAMSIASSTQEIYNANPNVSSRQLFNSAMTVGQDIMGTMSNTLILAYTGSSIPLLLIFLAYETPSIVMFNMDLIATEIVRSLAGSIGLILTIPITGLISIILIRSVQYQHDHLGHVENQTEEKITL